MAILKNTLVDGDLHVSGSLYVSGNIVQTAVEDLQIKDKHIELASGSTTKEILNEAGIQFGAENLEVYIKYKTTGSDFSPPPTGSTERLVISPAIQGTIDSASHASEVQWKGVTNSPLFYTLSFVTGVFTASVYKPTHSRYLVTTGSSVQVKIPTTASHIGAVSTQSFTQYTQSLFESFSNYSSSLENRIATSSVLFREYTQSVRNTLETRSALFEGYKASASAALTSLSESVNASFLTASTSFSLYSSSASSALSSVSSSFSKSLGAHVASAKSASVELQRSINTKLNTSSFSSWTSSATANFNGTSSYSKNGPFLHITGGVVTGSVIVSGSGSIRQGLKVSKSLAVTGSTSFTGSVSILEISGTTHTPVKISAPNIDPAICVTGSTVLKGSVAEGWDSVAPAIKYSHAEGNGTMASGLYSHAEGGDTIASGQLSHAEGQGTVAEGEGSHAEGMYVTASGKFSHAGGSGSKTGVGATGSFAFGDHVETNCSYQTVVGRYNTTDSKYAFIVGAGSGSYVSSSGMNVDSFRQNALAVRWDGNIDMLEGKVIYGTASYALNFPATGVVVAQASELVAKAEVEGEEISRMWFDAEGNLNIRVGAEN